MEVRCFGFKLSPSPNEVNGQDVLCVKQCFHIYGEASVSQVAPGNALFSGRQRVHPVRKQVCRAQGKLQLNLLANEGGK